MKGLEALEIVKDFSLVSYDEDGDVDEEYKLKDSYVKEELLCIEKELKVLQILKEKKVDLDNIVFFMNLKSCSGINYIMTKYNDRIAREERKLTYEEVTLIVEWLKEE